MASRRFLLFLLLAAAAGCITGQALSLPGDLSRPASQGPAPNAVGTLVAVIDFAQAPALSEEIGRDYDHVRPIRWRGAPGKAMADLVAAVLAEKGFRVERFRDERSVPPDAAARVWGRVDEFRVDAKRVNAIKAEAAARVAMAIFGSGGQGPPGWSADVASDYGAEDAFVTPGGVRTAMNGAANGAAEEAVRRLTAAGIVPSAPGYPPASTAPK